MTRSLERRVDRLERSAQVDTDVDRPRAIVHAYEMVKYHPDQATDEDRALAAVTSNEEWQLAFATVFDAEGGLAAVVRRVEAEFVEASMKPYLLDGAMSPESRIGRFEMALAPCEMMGSRRRS
jgi:hypothetical protein